MTTTATIVIRQKGEGEKLVFAGGGLFTMKATSAETGGAFLLFEDEVPFGKVTPLHLHPNEDETIYVLEGEILAHVDGTNDVVGTGGLLSVPRGIPHAFKVTSKMARLLFLQTPGSGEAFYREASDPSASPDDATRPPDFGRLRAVAQNSPSIELLGPPPFSEEPVEAVV